MRIAHFDCFSGISGDMTVAALLDAGVPFGPIRDGVASLGLPVQLEVEKVRKGGFAATNFRVEAPIETEHRHLQEIEEILNRGQLTQKQRELALAIFRRLAQAEAAVHGIAVDQVHFHEVGALDSIADIVAAAIGLDLLNAEHISSAPVAVGGGMVKCAHGLMPVPAPATAELLKGVPLRSTPLQAELTTPTGAAILTTIVKEWIDQPVFAIDRIGHGAGKRNFVEQPNLLRLFIGDAASPEPAGLQSDQVWVLETNLDNDSAEIIGHCFEQLFAAGALDVFSTPIQMKKNRPGSLLSLLATPETVGALENILLRETGTLGVRRYLTQRHKLHRKEATVYTSWGPVRGKLAWREGEKPRFSPEFEDCARVAREYNVALRDVMCHAQCAYENSPV